MPQSLSLLWGLVQSYGSEVRQLGQVDTGQKKNRPGRRRELYLLRCWGQSQSKNVPNAVFCLQMREMIPNNL